MWEVQKHWPLDPKVDSVAAAGQGRASVLFSFNQHR